MNWQGVTLAIVTILIMFAAVALFVIPAKAPTVDGPATTTPQIAQIADTIVVITPTIDATVSSPLTIAGQARGPWYFEASFPIILTDWDGKIIAQGHGQATSDWMTTDFVPFTATLTFTTPTPGDPAKNRGTLILKNDNPSGDPARDKYLEIPVEFK
jgi:hypothetical protein